MLDERERLVFAQGQTSVIEQLILSADGGFYAFLGWTIAFDDRGESLKKVIAPNVEKYPSREAARQAILESFRL